MTCVVGLIDQGKVWFGADSAAVAEVGYDLVVRKDPKVFEVGPFTIGFSGSWRQGQVLRFSLSPPAHKRGVPIERYLGTSFVDSVRKAFADAGVSEKKDNVEESGGDILVGYRGRLFCIESDFQVCEPAHPFYAIGCAAPVAMGALFVTRTGVAPKARVLAALQAAQAFNAGVRAPFVIVEPK